MIVIYKITSIYSLLFLVYPHRTGVQLLEGKPVKNVIFDTKKGLWTVFRENSDESFQVMVIQYTSKLHIRIQCMMFK